MRFSRFAVLSAVSAFSVAACGGGGEGQAAPATVVVTVSAPAAPAPSSPVPAPPSAAPSAAAPSDTGVPTGAPSAVPTDTAFPTGSASPTNAPTGGGGLQPSLGPDGRADPDSWPDACKLVTAEEVKSVLPDAINVRSAGQRGNYSSGGETPNYINCTHQVTLPTDSPGAPTQVEVELKNVADPRIIKAKFDQDKARDKKFSSKYPDQYKEYDKRFGGDDCYLDINALHCRAGAFEFEVGGRSFDSTGTDFRAAQRQFREQTLGKVVMRLTDKIESGGSGGAV